MESLALWPLGALLITLILLVRLSFSGNKTQRVTAYWFKKKKHWLVNPGEEI